MHKDIKTSLFGAAAVLLAAGTTAQGEEKIDFATQIYPFVKSGCVRCHSPTYKDERGRARRPKADLVITNKESFLKGGESGPVIVPGKPDESEFLHRTLLPLEDDDHQPPEGKAPQWTAAEKKLFEKWIAAGADFGDWTEDDKPETARAYIDAWDGTEKEADVTETFDSPLWKKVLGG